MTIVGGFFGVILSRLIRRLRALFPAEVTGTVVTMVALELVPLSVSKFLGFEKPRLFIDTLSLVVASITFLTMVFLTVWGRPKLRLYCILIGIGVGYISAYGLGFLTEEHFQRLSRAPIVSLPSLLHEGWSFSAALLIPFLAAATAWSLKTVGDLTICQKINDAEWKRPDMGSISGGILADACGVILSGALGSMGQSTSSSNVGLSIATGATSSRIAYACGGILILLAFVPKLAEVFVIMPSPVIGALLIFVVSFMIIAGIQIIMSRLIDIRKTFVIGISIIFGLSVVMVPGLYQNIHPWLHPLFSSSLSVATLSAIILNLIFRIGIAKSKTLELEPEVDSSEKIFNFMEGQGAAWEARKEVIYRAISATNEFFESVTVLGLANGKIKADVSFDEFNLDIDIHYEAI
jgi:NCS2 family nucleobase:cation symporter-2